MQAVGRGKAAATTSGALPRCGSNFKSAALPLGLNFDIMAGGSLDAQQSRNYWRLPCQLAAVKEAAYATASPAELDLLPALQILCILVSDLPGSLAVFLRKTSAKGLPNLVHNFLPSSWYK